MSALNAASWRRGIILWLAAVLLLASRSTHSAPVYDQDTPHVAEYDGVVPGCYFNFLRYQEGDRIITSEPCLNCTCHNRMLMCYLKVCPFTKAIGQDCTVEKRPDQCCPVITCPEVPVQLLTSTSAPAISDSTEVGFHDNYGCHVDERFYADGAMLPVDHHNPCELCYCIRNRTTCVMQECTLQVAGCKPVYQPGVCCPIKYNCEYDEEPSTTVGPTPGLIMTTTLPPGVLPQCYYEGKIYEDGDLIYSTQPCQHCYCFGGEIACAVQNCGRPMEAHGKNCTALPPPEGKCCPTTYQCEEDELETITPPEEQLPEQILHDLGITESPMIIDQEDQQVKDEHPQEEAFPGADNIIPQVPEREDEEGIHGIIEHITQGHIPSTEKPEEEHEKQAATLPTENVVPETETTEAEKEFTPSHEHETSSVEAIPEEVITTKVPSETEATKTEAPTTVSEVEEGTVKASTVELPEASSISPNLQPEEETITTERKLEEPASTEESIIEKEQSTESSVSEETHTEGLPAQVPEEATEMEKATEGEQITEAPRRPEISTDIIEKATLPPIAEAEEPSASPAPESITEQVKEGESKVETTPGETEAAEIPSESPIEQVTHEILSTERVVTESEPPHPTETSVTQEVQSTEVSPPEESSTQQEQKPVIVEDEEKQWPEQPTSEHTMIEEHVTIAKKEDELTESPAISEEPITEEETTPEIPAQGPTGIVIPEQTPKHEVEDKNVYHVTEDYRGVKPEISTDNLMTESPQEQEILVPSKETIKPILEEATEATIPHQTEGKPEIVETSTIVGETKLESTPAVTEIQASTESTTTIAHEEHIPEEEKTEKPSVPVEIKTEIPQTEVQSTEKAPSTEELPTKGLGVTESEISSEEVSGEQVEKEIQPKKEQSSEEEIQPSIATQPEEIPSTIPSEHEQSTEPLNIEKEQTSEGEHVTTETFTVEQSTPVEQGEEKEIETTVEEDKAVTSEKPFEEHVPEQSTAILDIPSEEEKELHTEQPISEEEQTTKAIKTVEEPVEKVTTQTPTIEESKTEQPEQYTEKAPNEIAITESHGVQETTAPTVKEKPEEIESTKGVSTESPIESPITEKELPKEIEEIKPTELTGIEQTELPTIEEHSTEPGEIKKEDEGEISVSVSTEKIETPAIESTKAPAEEQQTEKVHIEPTVSEEHVPSQPSIPSERKEDQQPIESKPGEEEYAIQEQITEKPSLEDKKVSETEEEPQKPTLSPEVTHVPEEAVTEGALPEEKPVSVDEATTQPSVNKQTEIVSEQPEEITTKLSEQEEQTQSPITEEQPEIHVRKETEAPSVITPEEPSVTSSTVTSSTISEKSEEDADVNKSTEATISEGTVSISEVSTASPELEEHTQHEGEVSIEKEIVSESVPLEKETTEITQPSVIEEKPSQEGGEAEVTSPEVSTEETIPETSEISTVEEHSHKPEEVLKETITEILVEKEHEEYSTVAPEEIPEVKITTEVPLKEIPEYSTEHPTSISEETSIEEETTSESVAPPPGIPGEGNCLVEGQSYSNNSAVPPANICQISCRCISSIVQCELVECPAPPAHLSNCMPVHTGGESCCPMYACDSTPTTDKLESDSHIVEPHIPEAEEGKKDVSSTTVSTEAPAVEVTESAKEPSTVTSEIITPESQPAEVTIPSLSPSQETEITETDKQQTTIKSIESVYEQPTTIGQPVEQHPEEHTISSMPETTQESVSQKAEEEHKISSISDETTEGKVSEQEESTTKASTEQPQKEVSDEEVQISTSTHESTEPQAAEKESSTVPHEEELTIPTITKEEEEEEIHIPMEITTIAAGKEETTMKEQEISTEKISIIELKPVEESEEKDQSPEVQSSSEIPSTIEETSTKSEESVVTEEPMKPEVPEDKQQTDKPIKEETTSIPEIQSTIAHKPEEEEQETVASSEGEQTTQAEKSESQTKLSGTMPSEAETQGPIVYSTPESTTLHDYTITELPLNRMTIKTMEVSTEESKTETESKGPGIEEEHVTIPIEISSEGIIEQETEKPSKEIIKPVEESIPEISHEETSPETIGSTESAAETTEHVEEHREPSLAEEVPSVSEEKPAEVPVSTEHPVKAVEVEETFEIEKTTEPSVAHEIESTQVSVEEHPEITSESESHVPELPAEEHTTVEEETTSAPGEEEISEQPVTSIIKETAPSVSEAESETPTVSEEHVTVAIEEQTPKSEEHPVEEEITSPTPSKGETTEGAILAEEATSESVTIQKDQVTEKAIESVKPETELPGVTEEQTVIPEIQKGVEEEEQQKPELGITEEAGKEHAVTVPESTEISKEGTTEETTKEEITTEEHPSIEIHPAKEATTFETEPGVHEPTEVSIRIEKPEDESQVSEASLSEQPTSEEATTIASLIPEEHATSTETKEKESTEKPEYPTTLFTAEEEVLKPATEAVEVEKLSPEEESATAEPATVKPEEPATVKPEEPATVKPEEPATMVSVGVSSSEKPAEILPETEKPTVSEQETESPEQQGETTTKAIESAVTEEQPEKAEVIPEVEEKPSEAPSEAAQEEETHPTVPAVTSIHEEEEPSTIKLQPTEESTPPKEETSLPEEIQPSQTSEPEEGEIAHSEESHPISPEEPQFTTEHTAHEIPVTIKEEEHPETEQPEISPEAGAPSEGPIKVSEVPTELPEEQITIKPIPSEEPVPEVPLSPEEGPQSTETPIEQHVIETKPELPVAGTPEEIPEEEIVHPQEGEKIDHPHIDHFPEVTTKPEPDYSTEDELTLGSDEEHLRPVNHSEVTKRPSLHEQQPVTTLAPHIPEYPDQVVSGEDNPHFPVHGGGYLNNEEDYDEDDQIYGPGTCRYGGKVYVSAQQIPRDDPCDFCFCFRSDIICLQQSCPPPIPGCHEEPISGFCCPRYECPVSMATALNLTTTTTTTTTTLPPHFHAHAYKGAARRNGCQINGKAYRVGEVIKSASGPCLQCTCGGDGNMKCDPRVCTPEPMLRQMIAAVTAERRRR